MASTHFTLTHRGPVGSGAALGWLLLTTGCTTTGLFAPTTQPNKPQSPVAPSHDPPQIVTAQPVQLYDATIPVQKLDGGGGSGGPDAAGPPGHADVMKFIERVEAARSAQPRYAAEANATAEPLEAAPQSSATTALSAQSPVIGVLRAPREAGVEAASDSVTGSTPSKAAEVSPRPGHANPVTPQPEAGRASGRTEPGRTEPGRTEPGRTEPGRAESAAAAMPRVREVVTAASVEPLPDDRPIPPPALNSPAAARTGPLSLREYLASQPLPPGESSFRAQLDQRILWLLAGEDGQALLPLSEVAQEQQELATRYLAALRVIRDAHLGDLGGAAGRAARELDILREQLAGLGDLSIPTLVLCRAVRGFGQYEPVEPPRFAAGREAEFVVYCEVRGFSSELRPDGQHHLHFDLTTTVLDESGQTRFELRDADITDQSRNRRQDCFLPRLVRLPADLPSGGYTLKVVLTDRIGRKVVERSTRFELGRGG